MSVVGALSLAAFVLLVVSKGSAALKWNAQVEDSKQTTNSNLQLDQKFLSNHCGDCHADGASEGGFRLEDLTRELDDEAVFQQWVRIHDRVSSGEMPPPDAGEIPRDDRASFVQTLKKQLHLHHAQTRETVLRRLNRKEYENTLNDLFGVDLRLADQLPEDSRSGEFDNIGDALGLSVVHLQKYMLAIDRVLDEAIADRSSRPEPKTIRGDYATTREAERFLGKVWKKLPDGAVVRFSGGGYPSGMMRNANTRQAGRYRIKVSGYAYQSDSPITFSVGGTSFKPGSDKPVFGYFRFAPGKTQTVELEARLDANYMIQIEPYGIFDPERYKRKSIEDYDGPGLAILSVELTGPLLDEFPSRGHKMIFDGLQRKEIEPRNPREKEKRWYRAKFEIVSSNEETEVRQSLHRVASFAFRRKVVDAEVDPYWDLYQRERQRGQTIETALRSAVTSLFCSPNFLYLVEHESVEHESPDRAGPDAPSEDSRPGRLDDAAIASRLSYFLHRSMPDRPLLRLASRNELTKGNQLRLQTERLMDDERFQRFVEDFTDAWLNLREMDFTVPDSKLFPEFDPYLRFSMPLETRAFLKELIRSNLQIENLVGSDFAMVNDRLARHYGIDGVAGPEIRKVALPDDSVRGGFLTQSAVLKVSANGTNTSPVARGVFVMERFLGERPQPPPPGIPGVEPDIRGATTLREQLDRHRDSVSCQACHRKIDPPGFALEPFNPIGGYRERYRSLGEGDRINREILGRKVGYKLGPKVDASGALADDRSFSDYEAFRSLIKSEPDRLARSFTEKLLSFATGRELGFSDREEIDRIVKASKADGYRVRDLIHLVIASSIFQSR